MNYVDRDGWNRVQQLNSLTMFVKDNLKKKHTPKTFLKALGVTDNHLLEMERGKHRNQVLPKKVNQLIEVFTDCEFGNQYNLDRVLEGKTKKFGKGPVKLILLRALEEAKTHHIR